MNPPNQLYNERCTHYARRPSDCCAVHVLFALDQASAGNTAIPRESNYNAVSSQVPRILHV